MNSEKKTYLNLVRAKPEIFDASAHYEFILVGKVKIETVDSFLNRGGAITYIGSFSDPFHVTNYPHEKNPALLPFLAAKEVKEAV